MKMARLFRTVWRINGVLVLLAFLLLLGAALVAAISSVTWRDRGRERTPSVVVEEKGERLFLGSVQDVEGTSFVLLPLESHLPGSKLSSGPSYESETRNLLFYDAGTSVSRWLRPDHKGLIVNYQLLRESGAAQERREPRNDPVRWIRYELALADTNHDGKITREDAQQLAISGPGGEDLSIVLDDVEEILGYAPPRDGVMVVFFRRSLGEFVGEIDLAQRKLRRARPLPRS
jgi:hypothetical protein